MLKKHGTDSNANSNTNAITRSAEKATMNQSRDESAYYTVKEGTKGTIIRQNGIYMYAPDARLNINNNNRMNRQTKEAHKFAIERLYESKFGGRKKKNALHEYYLKKKNTANNSKYKVPEPKNVFTYNYALATSEITKPLMERYPFKQMGGMIE